MLENVVIRKWVSCVRKCGYWKMCLVVLENVVIKKDGCLRKCGY